MSDTQKFPNHIVCYLDLLGYKLLVNDHVDDPEKVRGIQGVFEGAIKIMEGFKTRPDSSPFVEANKKLAYHMRLRMFSDSTLITMPLFNLPQLIPEGHESASKEENFVTCVTGFLDMISIFCLFVQGKLGHLYRGGAWIGQHYECDLGGDPNYQFMFSKALVEAHRLEQTKAGNPRIVMDGSNIGDDLAEVLTDRKYVSLDPDDLGRQSPYVDLYGRLDSHNPKAQKVLQDIQKGINTGVAYYRRKHPDEFDRMRPKYRWWIRYHNQKIVDMDFPTKLTINEEILNL